MAALSGASNPQQLRRSTPTYRPLCRPGRGSAVKENTICVTDEEYSALELIRAVKEKIEGDHILACIRINGVWQISVENNEDTEKLLTEGFAVDGSPVDVQGLVRQLLTVSFLGVPAYTPDEAIVRKLQEFGCEIRGPVIRKYFHEEPEIETGTRFIRVELPSAITSLPYAVKFENNGPYVRLIHTNQHKVCNHCLDSSHLIYNCPNYQCKRCKQFGHVERACQNFTCYRCHATGHKASECKAEGYQDNEFDALIQKYTDEIIEDETRQENEQQEAKDNCNDFEKDIQHTKEQEQVSDKSKPEGTEHNEQELVNINESEKSTHELETQEEERHQEINEENMQIDTSGIMNCQTKRHADEDTAKTNISGRRKRLTVKPNLVTRANHNNKDNVQKDTENEPSSKQ